MPFLHKAGSAGIVGSASELVPMCRENRRLDSSLRSCYPLKNASHPFIRFMKSYHGRRTEHGCAVDVEEGGECCLLDPRRDIRNHSVEFEWGYAGSGPAQLALALAADVLGDDDRAQAVYQQLKFRLIGRLPHEEWVLFERQIRSAIEAIEQERGSGHSL
jgi:hypothetical protein